MDDIKAKQYICECGKTFNNPQSFNGHKSHCKIHRLNKGGLENYETYLHNQANASKAAQKAAYERAVSRKIERMASWLESKPVCERCGKVMTEKYGTGRFCSETCAKARKHSKETKQKISATINKTLSTKIISKKFCAICGKQLKYENKTGVCKNCLNNTPEGLKIKQELGRKGYETMQLNGTHKGWQSRNITSYAENFWIKVLDNNNIEYKREVPVWNGSANYFLDFLLEHNGKLIDLEIDGKQHTYIDRCESDKIRDLYLTKQGYLIYRIPWNEITSEAGKEQMSQKVSDFLEFYKNI